LKRIVPTILILCVSATFLYARSEALAERYLQLFLRGSFYLANEMQSVKVGKDSTVDDMQELEPGNYHFFSVSTETSESGTLYIFHSQFEKGYIDFNIVIDNFGKVDAFVVQPTLQPGAIPDYIDTSRFDEFEITIGSDRWKLPGVLTVPKNLDRYPLVILIHDSGALDRDSTIGPNKPFRNIAWGLATRGVAVMRYDKRTFVFGEKLSQASPSIETEIIEDVMNAVNMASKMPAVSSIFLVYGLVAKSQPWQKIDVTYLLMEIAEGIAL